MITRRAFLAGLAAASALPARAHAALPSWLPRPAIRGAGLNQVTIDIPRRFALPAGPEIWVAPDGKDFGPGTFSRPFATLQHAFDRPETVVHLMPGRHAPAALKGGTKTILAPYGNAVIATPGTDIALNAFRPSNTPGIYVTNLPRTVAPRVILLRSSFDAFGFEQRLPNDPRGWEYSERSSELRIAMDSIEHRHLLRALYLNPYNRSSLLLNEGGTLAIGPDVTLEGVGIVSRPWHGHQPTTILRGCSILCAYGTGLATLGGVSFASNVRAHASQYDCFGYSPDDDGNPNFAIEYNCHASCAGDVHTYGSAGRDNLNGSSSHGSHIVRYGGLYEQSCGPDVVDTSLSGTEAMSINHGVMARDSITGIGFFFDGGTINGGGRTAYLNTCASERQTFDLIVANGAEVFENNSRLPVHRLMSGGKVSPYTG